MASVIAKLWTRLCSKRTPLSIMIVGLDNSGKSSILNSLATLNFENNPMAFRQKSPLKTSNNDRLQSSTSTSSDTISSPSNTVKVDGNNPETDNFSGGGSITPTVGYNFERIQYKNLTITVLDFSGQNRYRNLWQEFYNSVDGIVFVIDSSDLIRLVVVRDELETMLCNPYFHSLTNQRLGHFDVAKSSSQVAIESLQQKQLTISQGKLVQSPLNGHLSSSPMTTNKTINSKSAPSNHNQSHQTPARRVNQNLRRRTKIPILFLANKTDLTNSVDTEVIVKALNLNQLDLERHPWFIQATSVKLSQGILDGFDWLVKQLSVNN